MPMVKNPTTVIQQGGGGGEEWDFIGSWELSTTARQSDTPASFVKLNERSGLCLYTDSVSSTSADLKVCSFSLINNRIVFGTSYLIENGMNNYQGKGILKVDDNVFVVYFGKGSSVYAAYVEISVDGTITVGAKTSIYSHSYLNSSTSNPIQGVHLGNGKVVLALNTSSSSNITIAFTIGSGGVSHIVSAAPSGYLMNLRGLVNINAEQCCLCTKSSSAFYVYLLTVSDSGVSQTTSVTYPYSNVTSLMLCGAPDGSIVAITDSGQTSGARYSFAVIHVNGSSLERLTGAAVAPLNVSSLSLADDAMVGTINNEGTSAKSFWNVSLIDATLSWNMLNPGIASSNTSVASILRFGKDNVVACGVRLDTSSTSVGWVHFSVLNVL